LPDVPRGTARATSVCVGESVDENILFGKTRCPMTAATTANVEKIVRRVLKQRLDVDEKATLKAIQQVSRLLTDEVIPKLEEPVNDEDADAEPPSPRGRSFAAAAPPDDAPGIPEGEDPGDSEVPEAVTQAFEQLYGTLTQERATALATFFTTIGDELRGDEGAHDENGDTDDEDAVSDDEGEADHG
jgi:hypothetical protein